MSTPSSSVTDGRVQQTLWEASHSRLIQETITGVHSRFYLTRERERERLRNSQGHRYVVLNFSGAEKEIERVGSLDNLLEPHHIRVILGTEDDEIVDKRSFQDVLDVLEAVQPAIYVPDIVYSYTRMDSGEQEDAIEAYVYHVRNLQREIIARDLDIRLIPTNKGWEFEHFLEYEDLYKDYGYTELAFYAVGYTGGDAGNAIKELRRHTWNAIAALDLNNVFMIGRLGWDDLLKFAPEVNGACGLRQVKEADSFPEFQDEHEKALFLNRDQTQSFIDWYK